MLALVEWKGTALRVLKVSTFDAISHGLWFTSDRSEDEGKGGGKMRSEKEKKTKHFLNG